MNHCARARERERARARALRYISIRVCTGVRILCVAPEKQKMQRVSESSYFGCVGIWRVLLFEVVVVSLFIKVHRQR